MLGDVEILRVVQIGEQAILDPVYNTRLEIYQERAWDVVLIICLVEENVFPVVSLGSEVLQLTLRVNSVLGAEGLPELISNYSMV